MPAKTFSEILKFNPNHDPKDGKFTSGGGGGAATGGMKISTFSIGATGSEVYMRSEMKDGDKVAGYVEYSIYDDVPAIQYIHTEEGYERQGVATKLMQDLQSQYPDTEIQFGMTTTDGTKFLDSITYEAKDEKVAAQKQKMDSMKEELAQNEAELNRLYEKIDNNTITEAETEKLNILGDRWDELNDGIRSLEDELWDKKETKRFVKLDTKKSITLSEEANEMNSFKIFKADEDKRLVFGWASVAITVDGEELEDMQHDMIDPDELEEAAYEYVLNFRDTGEEHLPGYRKKGRLVESCVFTPDKQKAMGIPEGILPVAWWIGFKIDDDAAWRRIKDGTYRMFSIEGKAQREPVEKARRNFEEFPGYWEWLEENMNASKEDRKAAEKYYGGKTHLKKADKPTGCGVLVIRDGKVLTGTRKERASRGQICGPGGHIEAGETPEEAARREAEEEFGIICNELVPLGVQSGGGRYGTSAVFMCTDFSGTPKTDEEEMTAPKWMQPGEISAEGTFPPFMQSLELLPRGGTIAKSFEEILEKFNPYHDRMGRFTGPGGGAGGPVTFFTNQTKDPAKQHWADKAKLREQERQVKILEQKIKDDERKFINANSEQEAEQASKDHARHKKELAETQNAKPVNTQPKEEPKPNGTDSKTEFKPIDSTGVKEMQKEMGVTYSREDIKQMNSHGGGGYFGTGNSFHLNEKLRQGAKLEDLSPDDRKTCEVLDKNMKPITRDIQLKRMVGGSGFFEKFGINPNNPDESELQKAVGKVYDNKGYSSTSFDIKQNVFKSRNVRLNIDAPKGTKAVIRPGQSEAEILLPRNTGMKVKGIRKTREKNAWGDWKTVYDVDVEVIV